MPMDLSRFHATFLAESREGLDAMEAGLLDIESGRADAETIHTVFRAAHSIKGGASTFGFSEIAALTHVLETLLDEMRAGKRAPETESLSALLASVDVLRALLDVAERGGEADHASVQATQQRLENVLSGGAGAPTPAKAAQAAAPAAAEPTGWNVVFKPHPSMFMSGNDPLRILRELQRLGDARTECHFDRLPGFADMDPFEVRLWWEVSIDGALKKAQVEDVFSWVEDECDLEITPQKSMTVAAPPPAAAPAPQPVSAAAEPQQVSPQPSDTPPVAAAASAGGATEGTLRVQVSKVDALINLVGELVITQAMLKQAGSELEPASHERLLAGLVQLERNTRDLQEAVIGIRMLPVGSVFSRFPRLVRDLSTRLNKQVRLKTVGEATELDKGVIEKIADPLVHLVRNSIDHGLETTEERRAAGKPESGNITLAASHQGGHIVIEVADDGRGLNRERILRKAQERGLQIPENASDSQVWELIFAPGFSTADQVTDLSGRGVGMDVVRKNILALGGEVGIESHTGKGTKITVRLPLTLAILDGMLVQVGGETFVLPLGFVIEALQPQSENVRTVQADGRVLKVRGDYLPLFSVARLYKIEEKAANEPMVVVVESDGKRLALEVDALLGQQQVVVKNLEANYRRIPGISGATILGDGRVALIVDVGGLARGVSNQASAS
ncbi:chemotaxis protein CheA [Pseudomarimonas salicorniae]|uniref:Chemotaxis protein CheA n=1 Tax=Pseudomarimonas salicorniae TaxID=2933270 RepID=A0ABT0GLL6_9GAMM|nr:chemotaxis protein CheA [Lysobacter sp. CAU 1642]MCK7595124.1 chemotaxis protein CheA [Lysobacter sp. CAU 1642]